MALPIVTVFLPDVRGGVESVIRNLINHIPSGIAQVETVLYYNADEKREPIRQDFPCRNHRLDFRSLDNLAFIAKKMAGKMNTNTAIIVATDYLEMAMVQSERITRKVVHIVLGDFKHYYDIAVLNEGIIDTYIAISLEIYNNLCAVLPHRKEDIKQFYYPTPFVGKTRLKNSDRNLKIIYVARFEEGKNVMLLPQIDDILINYNISVQWTIVGNGELREKLEQQLTGKDNFTLAGFLSNDELHTLYHDHDIFIITSFIEGLPVSLIEAMKTGLVPIVSDIPGGIREIVTSDHIGLLCDPHNAHDFADKIRYLDANRECMEQMSLQGKNEIDLKFHPVKCSEQYWNSIVDVAPAMRQKVYNFRGSLLDRRHLPNGLVKFIRSVRKLYAKR